MKSHRTRSVISLLLFVLLLMLLTSCSLPSGEQTSEEPSIEDAITKDPAGYYFDFAIANRLDFVPEFLEGEAPSSSAPYLWYAFVLKPDKETSQDMSKEYVEDCIKNHFEVKDVTHESLAGDWSFDGETYHPVPTSYAYEPIYGLKELNTYNKGNVTVYNLLVEQYTFDEFAGQSPYDFTPAEDNSNVTSPEMTYVMEKKGAKIKSGDLTVLEAIREMISEGDVAQFKSGLEEWFQYYIDSKTGNVVFLEHSYLTPEQS